MVACPAPTAAATSSNQRRGCAVLTMDAVAANGAMASARWVVEVHLPHIVGVVICVSKDSIS